MLRPPEPCVRTQSLDPDPRPAAVRWRCRAIRSSIAPEIQTNKGSGTMASGPQSKSGGTTAQPGAGLAADFTKLFSEMKLPAMPDMEAFIAANRRNIETFTAANRVAMDGAQAIARRNMEIMQQSMAELTEAMKSLATAEGPQAKAAKQAEMLKHAYERAVANMQELRDLIQHSNAEALALINQRFVEAMDEVKALAEKP
jgi:phasin family protein